MCRPFGLNVSLYPCISLCSQFLHMSGESLFKQLEPITTHLTLLPNITFIKAHHPPVNFSHVSLYPVSLKRNQV